MLKNINMVVSWKKHLLKLAFSHFSSSYKTKYMRGVNFEFHLLKNNNYFWIEFFSKSYSMLYTTILYLPF